MTIGIEHVNDYSLIRFEIRIRIVAADSIRDSIRTEISDSQVPKIKFSMRKCYFLVSSAAV